MKRIKEALKRMYFEDRGVIMFMIAVFVCSAGLLIFSLTKLNTPNPVVKIGYGDIGGYRDGTWGGLLTFPILALVYGILHNLLAVRIYDKRGAGMANFFLLTTMVLVFGTLLVLIRLTSEV